MQALIRGALACAIVLWCAIAQADAIKHPSGFTFDLPDIGKNWEQEVKGDLIIANDETDKLPEFTLFVFPAKQEGTLDEIQGRLLNEVTRPGVSLDGEAIKSVKVTYAKKEPIADASTVRLEGKLNDTNAVFAIVQRNGKSLILVGVPGDGLFARWNVNFRELVKGLQKGAAATATKALAPSGDTAKLVGELMPEIAIVKEVTATSTFADKGKKDAYSPNNVLWFGVAEDKVAGVVPKTAWCEGKPDEGVGETLTITFARPEQVDNIEIASGVWLTEKLFNANNQITALDVLVDGTPTTVKPNGTRDWTQVKIGKPVSSIAIKLAAVKKGKMNDSCISGVRINRGKFGLDLVEEKKLSADQVTALPKNLAAIQAALVDPSYAAMKNVIDFPFTNASAMVGKKTKFANWKALDAVCKAKRGDADTSNCPYGKFFDDRAAYGAHLSVAVGKPGELSVDFPPSGSMIDNWRLKWRDGAWRLVSIETRAQERD